MFSMQCLIVTAGGAFLPYTIVVKLMENKVEVTE